MSDPATLIRVLVANMPRLLEQLVVELLQQQPDMQLVGQVQGNINLLVALMEGVDVLILGTSHAEPLPGICSHLLLEFPNLRILVLEYSGDAALVCWLGLRQRRLRSISAAAIVGQIRRAHKLNPVL